MKRKLDQEFIFKQVQEEDKKIVLLNDTAFLEVYSTLPKKEQLSKEEFLDLWNLKPSEKPKCRVFGGKFDARRWTKTYLQDYKFSGENYVADNQLPSYLERMLSSARLKNPNLNQVLVNWYDRECCIGAHADNEKVIVENSDIFSYSFGSSRNFCIHPNSQSRKTLIKFPINNNSLIIMRGTCQQDFKHSVPYLSKKKFSENPQDDFRINVTFRCFKNNCGQKTKFFFDKKKGKISKNLFNKNLSIY